MVFRSAILVASVCSSLLVGHASGASVTWNLSGVTFDDGGTASRHLTYDFSTGAVTSFDITTAGGNTSSFPSEHYQNNAAVTNVVLFTGAAGSTNICGMEFDPHNSPFTLNLSTTAASTATCSAAITSNTYNWLPESGIVPLGTPLNSDFGWPNGEGANNGGGYGAYRNIVGGDLVASAPEPFSALLCPALPSGLCRTTQIASAWHPDDLVTRFGGAAHRREAAFNGAEAAERTLEGEHQSAQRR